MVMVVLTTTWHQYCSLFFLCLVVSTMLKRREKVRQRWTKKDKKEKIVVGAIKKKERVF